MDFEELMAKLAETDGFGDNALDAIKNRLKKPNDEAKNLRKRLRETESASEKMKTFLEIFGEHGLEIGNNADVNDSVNDFIKNLKASGSEGSDFTKQPEYIKLQKQLDKLQKQSETDRAERDAAIKSGQKTKIENSLQSHFAENIANGKMVLNLLINSSKNPFEIVENGDIGYALSDGDIITGATEIVDEYKKQHPDQVLNKAVSGAGSKPGNDFVVPKKFNSIAQINSMSAEQINALPPEQYNQMMQVIAQNTTNKD